MNDTRDTYCPDASTIYRKHSFGKPFTLSCGAPTARAIDGLEKALAGLGLLDDALAVDLRKPHDYPTLVGRGPRLGEANSLAALVSGTVQLVGGPLGGALYVLVGFAPVVAIDAGSYLASAALIVATSRRPAATAPQRLDGAPLQRFAGELRAGAAHIRSTPGLPILFTVAAVFFLGNAALTALLVPFVGTVLHAAAGTLGWLFAALGIGYLAGAPLSRAVTARLTPRTITIGSLAALGAVFAATFNTHHAAGDFVLFTIVGPPAVCFLVTVDTFIARHTPDHLLGRTSSAYGMAQASATWSACSPEPSSASRSASAPP